MSSLHPPSTRPPSAKPPSTMPPRLPAGLCMPVTRPHTSSAALRAPRMPDPYADAPPSSIPRSGIRTKPTTQEIPAYSTGKRASGVTPAVRPPSMRPPSVRPPSMRPPSVHPAKARPPKARPPSVHPPGSLDLVRQSRDVRSRRLRAQRATTLHPRQLRTWYRHRLPLAYPEDVQRPTSRADCANVARPCPWVSCKYHLYLDVKKNGAIKLNFPDLEPHEMHVSCALDVAAHGGMATELVSQALNLTRERARQVEVAIMEKLRAAAAEGSHPARALLELAEDDAA